MDSVEQARRRHFTLSAESNLFSRIARRASFINKEEHSATEAAVPPGWLKTVLCLQSLNQCIFHLFSFSETIFC